MAPDVDTVELCDRYSDIYPGAIADVLDDRGRRDQILDPDIDPLTDEMTLSGIASPVVGRPNRSVDPDKNVERILEMLGDAPEHAVLTYETKSSHSSQIGELSVAALEERGCRGAVLDGGARDVGGILDTDFPVFASYTTPADAVPRWELLDWGVPAVVGGVEIRPGDVVVGDVDGVVVVPEDAAVDVLLEAEDMVGTEDAVRTDVRAGVTPLEAYEKRGKF